MQVEPRTTRLFGNVSDKTCLVTGANSGLGMVTATGLARDGAHVLMVCRTCEKREGEQARDQIIAATGNERVELLLADLSSQKSIRQLAVTVQDQWNRLDVLVNNAGTVSSRRVLTEDGQELQFAVNYLAPFLLTNLLIGALRTAANENGSARVVNVSSAAHYKGHLNFDDLNSNKRYFNMRAYSQSKLALVLFTCELARRFQASGITANCLCPGLARTSIGENNVGPIASIGWRVAKHFFKTPEEGAKTILYLASSPEVANMTGRYFENCCEKAPAPAALDETTAARLWDISERLTANGPSGQPLVPFRLQESAHQ